MGARASSILRKYELGEGNAKAGKIDPGMLSQNADWALVRKLNTFSDSLATAARTMEPSVMASYAHELAAEFSAWYRDNPVFANSRADLSASRVALVRSVKATLESACNMLCIPFMDVM
jgi:arginyl-tRNA synthetase